MGGKGRVGEGERGERKVRGKVASWILGGWTPLSCGSGTDLKLVSDHRDHA